MEEQDKFISEEKFKGYQRGSFRRAWMLTNHYFSPQKNKYIFRDSFMRRIFSQPSLVFPSKKWFFLSSESAKKQLDRTINTIINNLKQLKYNNHQLTEQILPELYGLNDKDYKKISWVFR